MGNTFVSRFLCFEKNGSEFGSSENFEVHLSVFTREQEAAVRL